MEINFETLLTFIEQYGYFALFFLLWLGIVGLPIPDELVVATGGLVASLGYLDPVYAFVVDYMGVVSGLTIGYLLGKWFGKPILRWLSRKKKMERYIVRSTALIEKYGAYALCLCYLFPVVRHIVPYVVAIGGMNFRRYALFSYTTGLVWTFFFYMVGFLFGQHMDTIIEMSRRYGYYGLGLLILLIIAGLGIRRLVLANRSYKPERE
ncbi:DedA family protein [Brevibacillus humidisoli]|uniref:DedA family protein n=1 Tax=Brevibacillus humidisoli TaxID=2895522 RepID=UPI001E621F67|nr:DedA family protein [Brevibacillus humidisoli]UFJ39193.1 DedA family protein [Brevibacillus humidisoli]